MLFSYLLSSALLISSATALAIENHVLEPRQTAIYGSTTVLTTCKKSGTFALTFDDGPVSRLERRMQEGAGADYSASFAAPSRSSTNPDQRSPTP